MSRSLRVATMEATGYPVAFASALVEAIRRWDTVRELAGRSGRRRLKRLLAYGVLWSSICVAVEVPNLPEGSVATGLIIPVLIQVSTDYLAMGLCLALALFWATSGRGGWRRLTIGVLVAAGTGSALVAFFTSSLWVHVFSGADALDLVEREKTPALRLALLSYYSWLIVVYGGLAAIFYALRRRMDQMTTALRAATLARERNEAAIAEARVSAMVERVEPDFLLEAMQAAREHYRRDPARGESIVNGCVLFLRIAMPQVRSRHSTLAAELDVAEAFLALRSLIATDAPAWRVERAESAGRVDDAPNARHDAERTPLPPLVLLPVLERLVAATAAGRIAGPLVVREIRDVGIVCIDVEVVPVDDAELVEAACLYAIDQRLRAVGGADAKIVVDRSRAALLVYRLHCPVPVRTERRPSLPELFRA